MDRVALKSFVDRIERLEEEQRAIGSDKRDVYGEVKSAGYNTKALRKIIAERRQKDREQIEAEMEAYRVALGMAVEAVSNGDTSLRRAAKQFGVSKSAIHRLVPREEKSASGTAAHKPEDGDGRVDTVTGDVRDALTGEVTSTCGDGESRPIPALPDSNLADESRDPMLRRPGSEQSPSSTKALPEAQEASRAERTAGVAPGPQDSITDDDPGPIPHFLRRPKQEARV